MGTALIFESLEDVRSAIFKHELESGVKFIRRDVTKGFGSEGTYHFATIKTCTLCV
jgi:hypothetical protein